MTVTYFSLSWYSGPCISHLAGIQHLVFGAIDNPVKMAYKSHKCKGGRKQCGWIAGFRAWVLPLAVYEENQARIGGKKGRKGQKTKKRIRKYCVEG